MNQIKGFITALQNDIESGKEFSSLLLNENFAEIIKMAAQKGFAITEAELRGHIEGKGASGELSEDALEDVTGGFLQRGDTPFNTIESQTCWYSGGADGMCNNSCIKMCFDDFQPGMFGKWFHCVCHKTRRCVDNKHHVGRVCT